MFSYCSAGTATVHGDSGPGCLSAFDWGILFRYSDGKMLQTRVSFLYGPDYSCCHGLDEPRRLLHFASHNLVDFSHIHGVFQIIRGRCPCYVQLRHKIHDETVALLSFLFAATVVGMEFHSFKFKQTCHNSYVFILPACPTMPLKPTIQNHLPIIKTQGRFPIRKPSLSLALHCPAVSVSMNSSAVVMSAATQSSVSLRHTLTKSSSRESLR